MGRQLIHISSEYFKTCISLSLRVYSQHMHNTMYLCTSFKMSACTRNDLYHYPYALVTNDLYQGFIQDFLVGGGRSLWGSVCGRA